MPGGSVCMPSGPSAGGGGGDDGVGSGLIGGRFGVGGMRLLPMPNTAARLPSHPLETVSSVAAALDGSIAAVALRIMCSVDDPR